MEEKIKKYLKNNDSTQEVLSNKLDDNSTVRPSNDSSSSTDLSDKHNSDIIFDDNLDLQFNLENINQTMLYSLNDTNSNLELIINNFINLEFVILSLCIIVFNILVVRILLENYKPNIIRLINVLTFKKLNVNKIVNNILIYNLIFYNNIIKLILFIIFFFILIKTYFILNLYLNSIDITYNHFYYYKLINEGVRLAPGSASINPVNIYIKSKLENIYLIFFFNNLMSLLVLLYLIFKSNTNKQKIVCVIIIFICVFINFSLLYCLRFNLDSHIKEFLDIHLVFDCITIFS